MQFQFSIQWKWLKNGIWAKQASCRERLSRGHARLTRLQEKCNEKRKADVMLWVLIVRRAEIRCSLWRILVIFDKKIQPRSPLPPNFFLEDFNCYVRGKFELRFCGYWSIIPWQWWHNRCTSQEGGGAFADLGEFGCCLRMQVKCSSSATGNATSTCSGC